jgi:aminoglycoside phosphotransferase (APT) family kinase protein
MDDVIAWAARAAGGELIRSFKASGGNRRQSLGLDVRLPDGSEQALFVRHDPRERIEGIEPYTIAREAEVYRAIAPLGLKAPRYIAENPEMRAVLTDRAKGIAEFRHLKDPVAKQVIAREFMDNLAQLHAAREVSLDGGLTGRIAEHVARDVALWQAMYAEVGTPDPLIELAFRWLSENAPDPDGSPVIVHGDAGPGNFMFDDGHLTTLIDWEFCHLGDPMEDLAWFSMRCVMEPVPDFRAALAHYEAAGGAPVDRARLLYHRVLVSARVCVIRHRNFAGEPAYAIVSRGLNRRLLIEALAVASGVAVPPPVPAIADETERQWLYDRVIAQFGEIVIPRSSDSQVIAVAKNNAKVVKYLKAIDRYGPAIAAARAAALARLGPLDQLPFPKALAWFAQDSLWEAQLSAEASGSIAHRHYDEI